MFPHKNISAAPHKKYSTVRRWMTTVGGRVSDGIGHRSGHWPMVTTVSGTLADVADSARCVSDPGQSDSGGYDSQSGTVR